MRGLHRGSTYRFTVTSSAPVRSSHNQDTFSSISKTRIQPGIKATELWDLTMFDQLYITLPGYGSCTSFRLTIDSSNGYYNNVLRSHQSTHHCINMINVEGCKKRFPFCPNNLCLFCSVANYALSLDPDNM